MAFYVVNYENKTYANDELYWTAIAGGQRAFIKMLNAQQIAGTTLMDQILYPLNPQEREKCESYSPIFQDFDFAFRRINRLSSSDIADLRHDKSMVYPNARLIEIPAAGITQIFTYRQVCFFKVTDYKSGNKYRMVPKMAAIQVYGRLYAALNAVDVRVEAPFIITVKE